MYGPTTWTFVAQLLISGSHAQNSSAATCDDVKSFARPWNSSTTREIQALKVQLGQGEAYTLSNDSAKKWELSLRVQPQLWANGTPTPEDPGYLQTLFLDTKDSNMTNIGSCHQTIQVSAGLQGYLLPKSTLERSVGDNKDCSEMLTNKCVQALKSRALDEALNFGMRYGKCLGMNNTLPEECSGMPSTFDRSREMNLTFLDSAESGRGIPNSRFSPDTECSSVNASSTHILTGTDRSLYYDQAVRMPLIDVVTFWPNRSSGPRPGYSSDDVRFEVFCLRPDDDIEDGSAVPMGAADLLREKDAKFPIGSGAVSLKQGVLGWMGVAVMGIMLVL
ncbi:hypothetical protein HBI81_154480 [Parastagonospora nodorum]|nr:hypothetical protein HBI09_112200 [Parastagonospora nodorum]KAH4936105.1 hypothetical protein HBI79_076680 [Parastagonospora nodorum]KAH5006482.1 hypothetical protein HBI77_108640 [Parastagonospora nodorum]KAH5308291.1 hypothetical protein HBI12_158450 [Parastagonospora nodorum]KAH5678103.1 hypothetical protein HBI23_053590 [Parastagonospora nodorum]